MVGGIGGIDNGLTKAITLGLVGGIGGIDNGLTEAITLGLVGGIGGIDNGLTKAITLGLVGGIGGIDRGLATIYVATAAIAALRTKLRIFNELNIMNVHSSLEKEPCKARLTQKGHLCYHKSGIVEIFLLRCVSCLFLRPFRSL
ncbi:MAG: hypothetical protein P4L50_00825 [Anaerolineaceae bacterium]|nr:hypothetical protein [Anaerolineaceae bacterium]